MFNFVYKEASRDQIKYLLVDDEHRTVDGAEVERLLDQQDHSRLKGQFKNIFSSSLTSCIILIMQACVVGMLCARLV